MVARTLELDDNFNLVDKKDIELLSKHRGVTLRGEVEVKNELGEVLFKKHNLIVIQGRLFVLEKIFNVNRPIELPTLAKQLGLPESPLNRVNGPMKEEAVCLFMVGNGGSELTFGDIHAPNFKDVKLFNPIPFRYLKSGEELTDAEKEKYFLKYSSTNGKTAYFCKKFEKTPELKVKRIGTDIDGDIDSPDEDFDIFVEMNLKIDTLDLREFYTEGEGIEKARFNELGLVIGYKPTRVEDRTIYQDYSNMQLFSKLTFNNEALDSNTKELNITYRIYA